jgi:probable HAF family extracellular repeat protein
LGVDATEKNPAQGVITPNTVLVRTDLGTLGGASSYAADINSANTVVGWSENSIGAMHAFRWDATHGMVDLGTLPGDETSRAVAVLDAGTGGWQILGVSGKNGRSTPVVWSESGALTVLPIPLLPNFVLASPVGFNNQGNIVGSDAGTAGQHGWIWSQTAGKYDLSEHAESGSNEGSASAITSTGLVLLTTRASTCAHAPQCWRASLWTDAAGYRPLGTPGGNPEAEVIGLSVNEAGTVVGSLTENASTGATPFRWTAGAGFTVLPQYASAGAGYGYATAVNSAGTIVGADFDPVSNSIVATAWAAAGGIVRLSPQDVNASVAIAVNNAGTIAGWSAIAEGVNHAVIWRPATQASRVDVRALASARVSTSSSKCLADARAITSRAALFACVMKANTKQ